MGKVRNIVRNIDGVELRTAMLFLWVSVFCFFGFVLALSWPGLAFADVACLLFFLITLVEGLSWVRKAFVSHYADSEPESVKYVIPAQESEEEEEEDCPLTQQELEEAQIVSDFFYQFFHLQEVGEGLWAGRGYPAKTYRTWIEIFRELRMVDTRPGAKPVPIVGYTRALEMYARHIGKPVFFNWVRRHTISYPSNAKVVGSNPSPTTKPQPVTSTSTSTSTARSKVEVEL